MKKIAVVLAGSGVYDGAEIHEATLTLLAIDRLGAQYQMFAPDIPQYHVVNHLTGEEMPESRNVLVEAARVARGKIRPLSEYNAEFFDALIFPGGFGVAKNLCSFAFDGPSMKINEQVQYAVKETHRLRKPIGALCIAPVLIAGILRNIEVTIGTDQGTAQAVESLGGKHKKTGHGEVVVDIENRIVSTPCYMLEASISQIAEGAENTVRAILELA
ncbi:MAG: isoprenoid biosynthesis glyoxalase ElbB [Bacteroidetes bacterium]|nr:isoprenoid biosynthesis glyoxalase ElbB [Bacteroidota bacterium]MBU1718625.1 isoprenoid biosynthesis glyoxalase ElbB [Bacteroidota bacterium]